jgi:hypothetical protein
MKRFYTDDVMATVRRMLEDGASNQQIADEIGTTARALGARLHQLGITRKAPPRTQSVFARVTVETVSTFQAVASARKMKKHRLICSILEKVAQDNLFTAVLDDE